MIPAPVTPVVDSAVATAVAAAVFGTMLVIAARALGGYLERIACRLQNESQSWLKESARWRQGSMDIAVELAGVLRSLPPIDPETDTCERVLVAIVQANGGFAWKPQDDGTRQLVREVRKMYDELDRPTPEPEGGYGSSFIVDRDLGDEDEDDFARVEEDPDAL